ncbi:MAG TPA: MFS transporter [Micropepsaceae bacterium]|nr:MFS transporter [Micropepsaceae bacterium]
MSSTSTTPAPGGSGQPSAPAEAGTSSQSFAALRHPGYRAYLTGNALAMMADSIEHVISYWIAFQKFHSPALGGFAMLSHWLPFLLFSTLSGALADRFDPRRLVQIGMCLFMFCSIAWSLLFLTDSLQMWHAAVLLLIHGCAGVFWGPPSQVLIHDIVGPARLPSAVRLMATSRYLGLLAGPAVGGLFLLLFGPSYGLMLNAIIYLPLTLWLWKAPYGPRYRDASVVVRPRAIRGLADILSTIREISHERTIVSMILLSGSAAMIVANAYQAQMPEFGRDLGHGDAAAFSYSSLLAADAAGALTGGMVLESRGLHPNPRTAFVLAMLWCCAIAGFALTSYYPLALVLLFIAGFLELSYNSMAQSLVQLHAPAPIRGRVIGLYSMAGLGLRAFSGITVGFLGDVIGIHWSLSLSALALLGIIVFLFSFAPQQAKVHAGE